MRCGIVGGSHIEVISLSIVDGGVDATDLDEHLKDVSKELNGRPDLKLGLVSLNSGGDHSDVEAFGADGVAVADHGDIDIYKHIRYNERVAYQNFS